MIFYSRGRGATVARLIPACQGIILAGESPEGYPFESGLGHFLRNFCLHLHVGIKKFLIVVLDAVVLDHGRA